MIRLSRPLVGLLLFASAAVAGEPTPIEATLAIQKAMADADAFLTAGRPADAVKTLEATLPSINGDATFLALLRRAYGDDLKREKVSATPNAERVADLEGKLAVLAKDAKPAAAELPKPQIAEVPAKPAAAEPDLLRQAADLFNQARSQPAKFAEAARFFGKAFNSKVELSQDQLAAWAYCRVKVAADGWNKSARDAAATAAAVREIEAALKLAPDHPELQAAGRKLIVDVGGKPSPAVAKAADTTKPAATGGEWLALESDNFRVRFQGPADGPKAVLAKAEEARIAVFAKWSSPPAEAWRPKCDVVLHATGPAFAAATDQPADAAGHAFVKLEDGRPTDRRLDLRTDAANGDETLARELTHVVLADLFPDRDPPKWAAIGMAVLAAPTEAERCQRTLIRCHRDSELVTVSTLLDAKGPKPEAVTAYYVESVSLVDHLVRKKGEKSFRIFLMDANRYGLEKALDRQYGYASVRELDVEWRRTALATVRGQKP